MKRKLISRVCNQPTLYDQTTLLSNCILFVFKQCQLRFKFKCKHHRVWLLDLIVNGGKSISRLVSAPRCPKLPLKSLRRKHCQRRNRLSFTAPSTPHKLVPPVFSLSFWILDLFWLVCNFSDFTMGPSSGDWKTTFHQPNIDLEMIFHIRVPKIAILYGKTENTCSYHC